MSITTENRLFERIKGELGVRKSPQGSNKEFCATIKNISGGGIRISLLKRLHQGTILDIEIFKYNTNIKTRCRGKIVWIWDNKPFGDREDDKTFEAGVEFINRHLLYIGRLIRYLENQNNTIEDEIHYENNRKII